MQLVLYCLIHQRSYKPVPRIQYTSADDEGNVIIVIGLFESLSVSNITDNVWTDYR